MNTFVLLLSTIGAGSNPAPAALAPAPAPAPAPAVVSTSSCGGNCGSISDCCPTTCCEKPRRSLFRRRSRECCETTCCPTTTCAPACCAPACAPASCAPASCCGTVSDCAPACCEKPRRSLFRRRSRECCEVVCDPCCSSAAPAPISHGQVLPSAPATPGKTVEPIKKLPKDEGGKGVEAKPMSLLPTGVKVESQLHNPF